MTIHLTSKHAPNRRAKVLPWILALLLLPLAAMLLVPQSAGAQDRQFHMDEFNADISINQDGSFDVVETLVYVYDEGSFHRGTRIIPLGRVESITGVSVAEVRGGQSIEYRKAGYDPDEPSTADERTFGTLDDGGQLRIRWVYEYVSNTSKTFRVSYHVTGGIRVYDNHDEFDWYAIPQDWASPIYRSRVQVNLPSGATADQVLNTTSKPTAETRKQEGSIVWTASGNLDNGLEVGVQLPKGVLQAAQPSWQAGVDAFEKTRPLINFALFLLGVLLLVGGVIWSIMRWYKHGRDPHVKLFSDYITEPPSNLPPGLVGTLLDESTDVRDVIATVVDQGRKNNLIIQQIEQGGLFSSKDFQYRQTNGKVEFRFEEMVLNALFKHGNPVNLSDLKNSFYSDLPAIYSEMYRSLVALKYFPESPQAVRTRNVVGAIGFFALAGLALFAAAVLSETFSPFLWLFPIALGAIGLVRLLTAHIMPSKTNFGAEEAEKWRAFSRYLQEMQRYTDVQAAAGKFQQYLPYAVALGIENQLIRQFNSVPAAMPPYYIPYGYGPMFPYPIGVGGSEASTGGAGGAVPQFNPAESMQGMSDSLAGAMQGMSDSFTSMVNSASSALTSQPQPQGGGGGGGGWGGGGGSFGGGGGGGGGGGAD